MGVRNWLAPVTRAVTGLFTDPSTRSAAYGLLSGIWPGSIGDPPKRGTVEFLRAYSTMPWLRAVTHKGLPCGGHDQVAALRRPGEERPAGQADQVAPARRLGAAPGRALEVQGGGRAEGDRGRPSAARSARRREPLPDRAGDPQADPDL